MVEYSRDRLGVEVEVLEIEIDTCELKEDAWRIEDTSMEHYRRIG